MATNKHATIRYQALDRCFSNWGKRFYIDDLIEACNEAIYDFSGSRNGIKRRQVFDDITFMESEQGWSIPLERHKDGRRVYYRYSDRDFSINKQPIREDEANQIRETLSLLSRFSGNRNFEWIEELSTRLTSEFNLKGNEQVTFFEENPYLEGTQHLKELFDHIIDKKVIKVEYHPFKLDHELIVTFHPYFLKQYNNRWFVFGWNEDREYLMNMALDRIATIEPIQKEYIENTEHPNDIFEDVIGVSVPKDEDTIKMELKVDAGLWPYVRSKPIHGSQKKLDVNEEYAMIEIEIIPNYEFYSLLLSYGESIEIVTPTNIRKEMKKRIKKMMDRY